MTDETKTPEAVPAPAQTFTFEHTLEEINMILTSLVSLPFKDVAGLIQKIHGQFASQNAPKA